MHPKVLHGNDPSKRYPLCERLYKAGFTFQGLRTILSRSERRLAQETVRELLTTETSQLTLQQLYIIGGILGCTLQGVIDLIAQHPQHKHLHTAKSLDNRIQTPAGYVTKREFNKTFDQSNIPAPGWLDEIK